MHHPQLLGEMDASGIRVCEQCLSLAMAACLEGHRDVRFLGHFPSPPARERWLSEAALSLFDRLLRTGATPSTTSYALALKVPQTLRTSCAIYERLLIAGDGLVLGVYWLEDVFRTGLEIGSSRVGCVRR